MPVSPCSRTDARAKRLILGGSRPVLAIVAFLAAFVFAALPFVLETDHVLIVAPCLIGCFTCAILVIRLFAGDLPVVNYILLAVAGYLAYVAGEQWYLVALLAGGTLSCSILIARLLGDFVPVVRNARY